MTIVMCLHFNRQEDEILDHDTNAKYHFCTLYSPSNSSCNIGIHLIAILLAYSCRHFRKVHLNAKPHEVTLMMIQVVYYECNDRPQNKINNTIINLTLHIINVVT